MTFHNTNKLAGKELDSAKDAAQSQEEKIFEFFLANPQGRYAPHEIWDRVFDQKPPLTSIRRAITNLADNGSLVKTSTMIRGLYGQPTYTWQLSQILI